MATPKHRAIYETLRREIRAGSWTVGQRLPSEAELVRRFDASRITVGRAVSDLQRDGLVIRRPGSGSYVKGAAPPRERALSFGLLIPDLGETEIFEPICQGMMASPLARSHALLWGSDDAEGAKEERAWRLCQQYLERGVAGVFFAPLESPSATAVNRRIVDALDAAQVPVVLLDRTALPYPDRGRHDLVGLDNHRAGFVMADHLLARGASRLAFVASPTAASTVDGRAAGFREALHARGRAESHAREYRIDPSDAAEVAAMMDADTPDGIVCANDRTAGRLMQTLLRLGCHIPRDVRIVGIDALDFGTLLPVPLTSFRQPTRDIGAAAMAAMIDRVAHGNLPTRDILLQGELVVRASCGG